MVWLNVRNANYGEKLQLLHWLSSFLQQYGTGEFAHMQNCKREVWFVWGLKLLWAGNMILFQEGANTSNSS